MNVIFVLILSAVSVLTVECEDCAQLLKSSNKYLTLSNWVQEIYRSVLQMRSSKSFAKSTFSIWHRRKIGRRYGSLWQKGNLKIITNSQNISRRRRDEASFKFPWCDSLENCFTTSKRAIIPPILNLIPTKLLLCPLINWLDLSNGREFFNKNSHQKCKKTNPL